MVKKRIHARRIMSVCEKTHTHTHQKSCDPSFFKNTEFLLECVFLLLPDVADRSEFSRFSLQVEIVMSSYASKENHVSTTRGLSL